MFSSNRIGLRKMYAENALYRKDWKHFLPTLVLPSRYKTRRKKDKSHAS